MITLVGHFQSQSDVPLTAPLVLPTIRIRRIDTQAFVVEDANTFEIGDGAFGFPFAPVDGVEYSFRMDGDPTVTQQTVSGGRFVSDAFSGTTVARLEVDIPAILVDTGTTLPAEHAAISPACRVSVTTSAGTPAQVELLAWLERGGGPVTPISATIAIRNPDGTVFIADGAMTGPNADGVFRRSVPGVTLALVTNYYAVVSVTDAAGTVTSFQATPTIG